MEEQEAAETFSFDPRQANKAATVRSGQAIELMWRSCRTGEVLRGAHAVAKRATARADRRVGQYQVEEGLEDYYAEEQDILDAYYDEYGND